MAWSDLPEDLLRCISSHLPIVDFHRISAVCSSWHYALTASNALLGIRCSPSPWLLLSYDEREAPKTLTFLDFTNKKEGCLRRLSSVGTSHMFSRHGCYGSNNGWLVNFDKTNMQPRISNPIIKAEICLPSFFTIPQVQYDKSIERSTIFGKIVISSNDLNGTVVAMYNMNYSLYMAKLRDKRWFPGPQIPLDWPGCSSDFNDVYFYEEEQRFYAIKTSSAVLSFDLNGQNVELICPGEHVSPDFNYDEYIINYIIFLSGTLLKVKRTVEFVDNKIKNKLTEITTKISVFKFMSDVVTSPFCSADQWISIKDLGDCSIFVGGNQTFALHHTTAPGIKPNCIYFSDEWQFRLENDDYRDAGFFDLHTDSFQYFLGSGLYSNGPPSIWFTPSLS